MVPKILSKIFSAYCAPFYHPQFFDRDLHQCFAQGPKSILGHVFLNPVISQSSFLAPRM